MRKIYFTEEARRAATQARDTAYRRANRLMLNERRREARGAPMRGRYEVIHDSQEVVEVPAEVLEARQRLIEKRRRWLELGLVTPTQFWVGDGCSVSCTDLVAMRIIAL